MTIREQKEELEKLTLSEFAVKSCESKGRERDVIPCDIRTCFQRDRDRILHCKSFRRLKHKTQVFLAPMGDHYRTRLTHTLEVSQIARTIATSLRLNEDLTEAIALAHDLGHTPFGHAGERTLDRKYEFSHSRQSLRVVDILENNGKGLNLTFEVRDGILNHGMSGKPQTLEGRIVRLADKIAYTNHDMDDAIRAGILTEEDVPAQIRSVLGQTHGERLDFMVKDIIYSSQGKNDIIMTPEVFEAFQELRAFMTENLYFNPTCKSEERKADIMLSELYDYYIENTEKMPPEYVRLITELGTEPGRAVCDYISGMTDVYSVYVYEELFVPKFWEK
ncbi:MAG: deoxyguanosinetriphosphate triphosphohydrolase [Lachnospiraceae bacterium]|nr:deoxyguanosinetriphosphate triphosphohydrolase [Lachnospiraceae bacterium]